MNDSFLLRHIRKLDGDFIDGTVVSGWGAARASRSNRSWPRLHCRPRTCNLFRYLYRQIDALRTFSRNPLFSESTGLFVGLGFALKKKAFVGRGRGRRTAESESRVNEGGDDRTAATATAMAGGGGGGGLEHLADFKWWIGLTAIGLGAQLTE